MYIVLPVCWPSGATSSYTSGGGLPQGWEDWQCTLKVENNCYTENTFYMKQAVYKTGKSFMKLLYELHLNVFPIIPKQEATIKKNLLTPNDTQKCSKVSWKIGNQDKP